LKGRSRGKYLKGRGQGAIESVGKKKHRSLGAKESVGKEGKRKVIEIKEPRKVLDRKEQRDQGKV
jgi:hypothetical protein